MKTISQIITATALACCSAIALAQQPPAPPPGEGEHHRHPPRDCSKAPDAEKKERCEAMQAAMAKCKDLKPEEHHKCMKEAMPKKEK